CKPGTRMCVALKADAYGHGLRVVAPVLAEAGADCAAVANLEEAIELREAGWSRPILVLGHVLATTTAADRRERIAAVLAHDLMLTLCDDSALDDLQRAAAAASRRIAVHVKFDTGMGRMGAVPEAGLSLLDRLRQFPAIKLAGIYSH